MKLLLERQEFTDKTTIGELFVDGEFECYTLEDVVRHGPKVPGQTAIPIGVYEIIINDSFRFKRKMPLLLKVPGFEGVRIHSGNTDKDTGGCILVGLSKGRDIIGLSRVAFEMLFNKLCKAFAISDKIEIEIKCQNGK
jgi:hypothetical protein